MTKNRLMSAALSISVAFAASSCGSASTGENTPSATAVANGADEIVGPFAVRNLATFDEPWAGAFIPGTPILAITEKGGTIKAFDTASGEQWDITGAPPVDYGGQGGLGDIAFLPSESSDTIGTRTIYLSWAEAGDNGTRGAAVGRGQLVCEEAETCAIRDLDVIWRQTPKVTGQGHYSHRIAFSPDEEYLWISSGDRQKKTPAQDIANTLGTVVRLNLDGTPAAGNPFASRGSPSDQIWSYGHRNMLGLAFDEDGRLWDLEHGPAGGDELNLVARGANYGWPERSNGNDYNGAPTPNHRADDGFSQPAISWTPVIAPGNLIFYSGSMFGDWRGEAIISGLATQSVIRVQIEGKDATEAARYDMGARIRAVIEGPEGALYILEDGDGGRLRRLTPAE